MAEARHVRAAHLGEQRSWLFSIALRDGQPIDALFEILASQTVPRNLAWNDKIRHKSL